MSWDTAAVQKAETLRLSSFTSQTAHTLGESIRNHIRKQAPGKPAIVQITSGSTEQLLYFSTTAEGSLLDNKVWAARKWKSVIRFGKSTASLNVKWYVFVSLPPLYRSRSNLREVKLTQLSHSLSCYCYRSDGKIPSHYAAPEAEVRLLSSAHLARRENSLILSAHHSTLAMVEVTLFE